MFPSILACPVCAESLTLEARQWRCANGHSFDQARSGYVNLHLAQHKRSKQPGDDRQMLQARRRFLEAGHYDFLSAGMLALLAPALKGGEARQMLDIGCGEGYFTAALMAGLAGYDMTAWGMDVAKVAVEMAAKRYPGYHWLVASAARMPVLDHSVDLLVRINAPTYAEEYRRVLRTHGLLLSVVPGPDHLFELKQRLYQQPRRHGGDEAMVEGFERLAQERVQRQETLAGAGKIRDLLQMTPFFWHARPEQQAALVALEALPLTFDFVINLYKRAS